jgi:predicted PurR-regulated permease PerM
VFEGEGGATNLDALAVISTITSKMSSSIGNMYIGMLIMAFIVSILYWIDLLIAGKLLASHLTIKIHSVAAIIPVLVIFTLYVLPLILGIIAGN